MIESRWGGARFSAPVQFGLGAHPAYCTMGTASFPGIKSGRGVTLTPHPIIVPWSRKSRAVSLLPLWAVRPVYSLSACTRAHFNPLNAELNPICHLLALLGAHHILHVSRITRKLRCQTDTRFFFYPVLKDRSV